MSGLPDPLRSRAVLVGVSQYKLLPSLPSVANNLPALAGELSSSNSWGLAREACLILPEPQSANEMLDPIAKAADEAEDALFIYYAGHGLIDARGDLFLSLPDSRQGQGRTGVPYSWLRDAIQDGRAQRQILVLDCCFSGRALGMMGDEADIVADQAQIEGSYLLAAAAENKLALADPDEPLTAFTGALIDVLRDGVEGAGPWLDLDDVYNSVRRLLIGKGRPVPQKRDRNTAGRLLLARNHAHQPRTSASRQLASQDGWPEPEAIRSTEEFLEALAEVRALSGLTLQEVGRRMIPQAAAGTVGALLQRTQLPARWGTTGRFLAACGLAEERVAGWHRVWLQLKASALAGGQASEPAASKEPSSLSQRSPRRLFSRRRLPNR